MNNTVETNQTINMNGVVNMEMYKSMKKAELREVLKGYGLEISNNEFKATKHEELVGRIEAELIIRNIQQEVILMDEQLTLEDSNKTGLEIEVPVFDFSILASRMVEATSNIIRDSLADVSREVIVPAVVDVVEDGNNRILTELKSQLDAMNASIAGLVKTTPINTPNRIVISKCEDCGAEIYSSKIVDYSKANCGGHVYCYSHQGAHKVSNPNITGGFGRQQQPQPTNQPIVKQCMCCGTKTKYNDINMLNASMAKAQSFGLKPIICSACAKKELEAKASQPIQPTNTFGSTPIITQPVNTNTQGF